MPALDTVKEVIESFPGNDLFPSYSQAKSMKEEVLKGIVNGNCNNYCSLLSSHLARNGVPVVTVNNLPKHEYLLVIAEDQEHQEFIVIDPTIAQFSLDIDSVEKPYFIGEFKKYKELFRDGTVFSDRTQVNIIKHPSDYPVAKGIIYDRNIKKFCELEGIKYNICTVTGSVQFSVSI